ncbi:MAG: 4Fe-4S dicluster domain-containing protein [Desulfobacterium sp.]
MVKNSVLKHKEILKRPTVGAAHMAVFWGFVLPMFIIFLSQFGFSIPTIPARLLSLLQEVAGVAMLIGTVYLLKCRIQAGSQSHDKDRIEAVGAEAPKRTIFPMAILVVVLVSGFLAESSRLSITGNSTAWASPMGWLLSIGTPASPWFMQMMIRLHFFAVLVFIASIPFTFMRHLAASPLNVFYKKQGPKAALRKIKPNAGEIGAKTVEDFSWKQLLETEACVSCGRCEENCPAFISGKPLSPKKVIRKILEQAESEAASQRFFSKVSAQSLLEDVISKDEIWACTTCMACVEHCPIFVEPMDKIVDIRRYQVMGKGDLPTEARPMIRDLELYGDVQGKGMAHRADWAMNQDVPKVGDVDNAEVLFWVGCSGAFHPRNRETALAMVKIFKAANVSFGILAEEEVCCGEPARKLGDEALFQNLAMQNIQRLKQHQVKKIVTLCPHCLNTLKNEYPELGCDIPVVHATQFVMDLIKDKRITLRYPVASKMAVHDACYLGRYNEVYEPPRDICKAVPGTQLKELVRNRESSFCCGGGGGRMWLHENSGQNINLIRAQEIADADIDIIGTSCPFCLVMLDDGVKSLGREDVPKVADIIDIIAEAM